MRNEGLFTCCVAIIMCTFLLSCAGVHRVNKTAAKRFLQQQALAPAHVGISVMDAETGKYLYNHNGDKLFVPASNTKLFTCYASLKHLGDSLVGARYKADGETLLVDATGDPTFLHPDFKFQPLFSLMQQPRFQVVRLSTPFAAKPLGRGWAWDDYASDYMAERDPFPMYGNLATFTFSGDTVATIPHRLPVVGKPIAGVPWNVDRNPNGRFFVIENNKGNTDTTKTITLAMERGAFASRFLQDTLHKEVFTAEDTQQIGWDTLQSQPTDSVLRLMMHRSDNFIAEQLLLMTGNTILGAMDDRGVIDTLLKTDFIQLPQQPKWVDGSGLSRYNLFSPQDFVWVLGKMKDEFGMEKIRLLLPTGKTGTLSNLYQQYAGRIYAKTDTLSNNLALSGIVQTNKNRTLIFSVLVNNHQSSPLAVRGLIEQYITILIDKL